MKMNKFIILALLSILTCVSKNNRLSKEVIIQKNIELKFEKYKSVYLQMTNEIQTKISNRNKSVITQLFSDFMIDKLIVFNSDSTKLFTTINTLKRNNTKISSDLIQSLYGVKIDGKWLLFLGANLIALRESYKNNKYEPFSWDEISYVAHEQMFGRFLSIDSDNNLSINSHLVETEINPWYLAGAHISDEGTDDERFIRLWNYENSQTLDSLEIAQIKQDITETKVKLYEPIKRLTWWDKLWGAQDPIFETDEWKEYIKSKSSKK